MMTLITGVSVIIYSYSTGYMYQDRHARRYLAMICLTDFVLICMVSSANLMMLFLFWQVLSYLLYVLAHNHAHPGTLAGAFKTFTLLRVADTAFLAGIALAYHLRHARIPGAVSASRRHAGHVVPLAGHGHERRHRRHAAALRGGDGKSAGSDPSLAPGIAVRSDAGSRVAPRGIIMPAGS